MKQSLVAAFGSGLFAGLVTGAFLAYLREQNKRSLSYCLAKLNLWPFKTQRISEEDGLPLKKICIVTTRYEFDQCLNKLEQHLENVKLLGFDCEWVSSAECTGPVALLQIATVSGLCLLIRMCKYTDEIPEWFTKIMGDKSVIKVGVGPLGDAMKLLKDWNIVVRGCVDLRAMATRDRYNGSMSLKGLAENYLGVVLEKAKTVQCSNWEADCLSYKQVLYASNDAWVAVQIFSHLIARKITKSSETVNSLSTKIMRHTVWCLACSYCQGIKDVKFKPKHRSNSPKKRVKFSARQQMVSGLQFRNLKSYSTRKQPLYDNCKLQAPDGQLLSTCDRKKACWYLEKELADVISEDPLTVRLRFEPAGRPVSNRDYYLNDKENICVVCGHSDSIVRKNVIPHEYRRHFPLVMKDHVSHDILPMCVTCHQVAGFYDAILRQQISVECEAPLGSKQAVQLFEDHERRSVRSAGRALAAAWDKIPEPRKSQLETIITDFFKVDFVTKELIGKASMLETRYKNEAYMPHGLKVVSRIMDAQDLQGLIDFERKWRIHFLDSMQPKYLPDMWSVDHNHDRIPNQSQNGVE